MSNKHFISYDTVRNNAVVLAQQICQEGFIPDVIYVSLRGGAYMGNVISEYFKFVRRGQRPVFYAAVVARSYTDIREQERVSVDGWTYSPEHLRSGDRVLVIDDIFDTGRTVNHLVEVILQKGLPRSDVKIAVHDYKIRHYVEEKQPIQPDYYCRKHEIQTPEEDHWIHYLSHELVGLLPEEIDRQYPDERVRAVLHGLP
ncbi:phosphoribosyl transferase [Alkalispirochaeta sphaeroplastigenens]|uniref:Phosphoribosyl transferase n=1 Tax=Alkalispirochaeta sphaeroplastigenens TaxID=1187066 RepID=A0A2S4K0H4_9SPIO|nr:phosphoribosyltransferase family protein [Alkalispirochaeta sphaeroplastigenens]POR05258.1 phosphoribosyl transferase [Alkalispirochaeta sphaeroplastigenens]